MLQKIRDGLQGQRWLAVLIIGALGLVFAAWGAYGIVDLNVGGIGSYAAKVEGERISLDEARDAWSRQQARIAQQFGGELPEAFRKQMQEQLLESMIQDSALTQHARSQGYRVSDAQVHQALREIPAFQIDGKYSAEAAKSLLAQNGITPAQFEADLRGGLQRTQVQRGVQASDFVTPLELERLHALEDQQREVRYAVFPAEKFAGTAPVEDAAVQDYIKKNQSRYLTTESVRLAYGELRLDQVTARIAISEPELREEYEKTKSRYEQGERRQAHHILIKDEGAQSLAKAQEVLAEARKPGQDFGALARKHSADPGSAAQGGDLGLVGRGNFVKPFEDALFAMSVGEIRGPVKTEFGYHIIRLDQVVAGHTRTFEEARPELEAQLRSDRALDQLGDAQERMGRKLEESGGDFDALVKEFGLQAGEIAQYQRGAGGAPLGTAPELQELVFSAPVLHEKRIGGPIAVGEDRIVIVKVLEHRKPQPRPVAEIREEVVAAIRHERGSEGARKAADAARARLLSGASFDDVAKEQGVAAEAARFIGRDDPSVPAAVRSSAFEAPKPAGKPTFRAVQLEDGGSAVLAVTAARLDPTGLSAERQNERRDQATGRHGAADVAAYVAELRRAADVDKNPKAFE
jgi:peptidyl-prolyl cis-trans isomerase D